MSSGQNSVSKAYPIPESTINAVAVASSLTVLSRCAIRPTNKVIIAGPSSIAVVSTPTSKAPNPMPVKYTGTRMLTNPSPNARTPRAVSRRRALRRSRWELLIGGAADVGVFQEFRGNSERCNGCLHRWAFAALGLGCAALWP
jgi:hypothetical protein